MLLFFVFARVIDVHRHSTGASESSELFCTRRQRHQLEPLPNTTTPAQPPTAVTLPSLGHASVPRFLTQPEPL